VKSAFLTVGRLAAFGALWLLPELAFAAPPEPRAQADALIQKLDAPATRERVAAPLAKAKEARTRAQSARGSGDLKHAAELEGLALLWAEVADDLLSAADAEQKLSDVQKKAGELERKLLDTQALVEQAIARRGRAQQNLMDAEQKSKSQPPAARKPEPAKPSKPAKPSGKPQGTRE
jgi:hypothetical protein